LADRIDVDARSCALGEFALHQVRDAERELNHFDATLDIALGIGQCLAVLARKQFGQRIIVTRDQFQELHQHAYAPLRVCRGPGRLRRLGIGDRCIKLRLGAERHPGTHRAVQRLENVCLPPRSALDVLAANEMSVLFHQSLPEFDGSLSAFGRGMATRAETQRLCGKYRALLPRALFRAYKCPSLLACCGREKAGTMNWDDVRIFLAVARAGQILGAARRLQLNHATVSRRVAALEEALRAKLFRRLTTGSELTP